MKEYKKSGISLIETLTVIGIITLITLVSVPSFLNYQKGSKLRGESRILATNIRYAQQLAITTQNIFLVRLFAQDDNSHYQIINAGTDEVIKDVKLDSETKISSVVGITDNTIHFISTGGVVEAGEIYLANTINQTSTLRIKPSGYVQIVE
ncbi:MAG: hypothetical protein WCX71_02440 [Candidatus Buchananbacteria bacterium]